MAKVTTITVSTKSADGYICISAPVSVNSKGIFSAVISKQESLKLCKYDPLIPDGGKEFGPFSGHTLNETEGKLKAFLEDVVSCECIEEKEVIRYQIETACSYCIGDEQDNYEVYPNGIFMPDRLKTPGESYCNRWRDGTLKIYAMQPSPYFTKVYCEVYIKKTYAYRSGKEVTRYEIPESGWKYDENDNVAWLKHLTSISPISNGEIKEVDATQENATVFVQLIKFICKANRLISELANVDGLLAYAENINNGPLQIDL